MTHEACESKLRSVVRSSMHPYPGNWVAIALAVVYYAWAAHAFSAGIKCRHCSLDRSSKEAESPWHIFPRRGWVLCLNPFTLRAAKTGLTFVMIFFKQKHFLENTWRRNYNRKPNNNSPSNILLNFASFPSYFFLKQESSRRYFLQGLQVWMG